ncbi:unnamed protein product [Closterium sp. NIES-65]|nr:unnamed protein product [Closterium sp. NIES-65]
MAAVSTAIQRLPGRKITLVRVTSCALLLLVVSSLSAHAADMKTRGGTQQAPDTQPASGYTKPPTLPPSAPTSKSNSGIGSPFDQDPFAGSTPPVTPVDSDDPLSGEEDPDSQPPPTPSATPAPNPPKESPPPTKTAPSQPKPSPVPAAPVKKPTSTPSAPSSVVSQGTSSVGKSFGGSAGKSPVNHQVGKAQTGTVNPKPKPKPSDGKVKASQADDDNDVIIGPATCLQSTLSGFTNSVNLTRLGGLSLHWKITSQSSIDFALEAKPTSKGKSGWAAVGWSARKSKFPSDLIVGNLPSKSVGAYDIYGYGAGSTLKSKSVHLSDTSIEKPGAGGFIARFTRSTDDGTVPVNIGPNRLIWAWSVENTEDVALRKSRRGELVVDFTCAAGAQPVTTQSKPKNPAVPSPKSPSPSPKTPSPGPKTSPAKSPSVPAKSPSVPAKFPSIPPKSPAVPGKSPATPSPKPPTTPAKNTSSSGGSGSGGSGGLKTGNSCDASALLGFTFSTPLVLNKLYLHWKIIGTDILKVAVEATLSQQSQPPPKSLPSSRLFRLYLHWKIIGTNTLKVAVEAKSGTNVDNGWYGVGWSREGAMAPADAVLGNLAGGQVKAYMLGGYTKTGVQVSNRLTLVSRRCARHCEGNLAGGQVKAYTLGRYTKTGVQVKAYTLGRNTKTGGQVKAYTLGRYTKTGGQVKAYTLGRYTKTGVQVKAYTLGRYTKSGGQVKAYTLGRYTKTGGQVKAYTLGRYTKTGGQVKAYTLGRYTKTGVQVKAYTLGRFYRKVADGGLAPIMDLKTPSYIIWAYAQDMFQTVGYHGANRGLHQIDFSCNQRPKVIMAPGSNKINDKDDDDDN